MGLFLYSLFCSTYPYICFCASITVFWLLQLCSIVWSLGARHLQLCFFLKIALAIWGLLWFQINFRIICSSSVKNVVAGTSLVVQWLGICLPTQGKRVRALVQEDPTCSGATKPVRHNHWACALEPTSHNYGARVSQLLKPACLEPVLCNKRSHRSEKPAHNKE